MARLNTHLSATPQLPAANRSSTVDSLYRDPSIPRHIASTSARNFSYSVVSPSRSGSSDKENQEPRSQEDTPRAAANTKRRMAPPSTDRLQTPAIASSHRSKRRRTDEYSIADSPQMYEDASLGQDDDGPDGSEEEEDEEDDDTKFYDPNQDPEVRRELRANMRNNQREIEDNRDELIKPGNDGLIAHIKKQNYYMGKVKQTADAALDSRVMVYASDLASKKLKNTLHGNTSVGIDVDQFVTRCIHFMKSGGDPSAPTSTQGRHRRRTANGENEDEDEDDDDGEALDWALLGREACFPFNKRPPASSFLLGPLSVQKRVRTTQSRRTRLQRQLVGPATRPQELTQADIKQSENSNLTHLVKGIQKRLTDHIDEQSEKMIAELNEIDGEPDEEDIEAASRRHRIWPTPSEEAAVSLFDFVVNPHSFGQTVENLFYVSFLIKEGAAKVVEDDQGLPLLMPANPHTIAEQREHNVQKHQAVFSLDWPTWKKFITAFDIKEPLIPHRLPEETTVTAGGWYG